MRYPTLCCALCLGLILQSIGISAKIYHTDAPTYPIAEPDLLQVIQATLKEKTDNGELARWQEQQFETAKNTIDRPEPVNGLTPAITTRSWLFNPSITLPNQSTAGKQFNPLDKVTWTDTLIFYDGDNPEQVAWAVQLDQELKGKDKLILINGSVNEQMQKFQKRIYFDQGGRLIQKFNIQHTPATVNQEGKFLRITEIKL